MNDINNAYRGWCLINSPKEAGNQAPTLAEGREMMRKDKLGIL